MSTARRRLKSPRSLSGTSAHPTMVTQVNIMVMNGWLTSFSFIVKRPSHSWDKIKLFETLTLKPQGQGHGCGQKARSYNRPSIILFTSFSFHINQTNNSGDRTNRNLTLKHPRSRSWVRSKVKVTCCTQYPTNALPFRFTSIGPSIPEIWPK